MSTQVVWRLEDKKGIGIYNGRGWGREYLQMAIEMAGGWDDGEYQEAEYRHAPPYADPPLRMNDLPNADCYIFGFGNLEQFREWVFNFEWRKNLAELGVLLNRYEVESDYCRVGFHQAIFRRDHAKLIESVAPDSIH